MNWNSCVDCLPELRRTAFYIETARSEEVLAFTKTDEFVTTALVEIDTHKGSRLVWSDNYGESNTPLYFEFEFITHWLSLVKPII